MLGILQGLKKERVSAYPTDILWRAGPRTCQTARRDPEFVLIDGVSCETLNFFDGDLVHPAIAQVIFIGQLQPIIPDRCIQFGAPTISNAYARITPIRIGKAIDSCFLIDGQSEQIQMS